MYTSHVFARFADLGCDVLDNTVADWLCEEDISAEEADALKSKFYSQLHSAIEALDDRLWWQPETSEVFYEDDESGRELPFENDNDGFIQWFNEAVSDALASL